MKLAEYFRYLRNEVTRNAGAEGGEMLITEAFVQRYLELLAEAGEIADAEVCCYNRAGRRVDGYTADENEDTLDLFVAVRVEADTPSRIEKAKVDAAFRQLAAFYTKSMSGLCAQLAETEPAFAPSQLIYEKHRDADGFSRVRLFLVTDGIVNTARLPDAPVLGDADVSLHVWDIERLFRWFTSGKDREQIVVDLAESNLPPVTCLEFNQPHADFVSYLAIFPAETLVSVYGRYGPRLLERNVRSFLQVRGDINKGIRSTIISEPERFFAYNNGLTVTASEIEVERTEAGALKLMRLVDLQIVNGGQTTASLYRAVRKDKADVSRIAVPVKLNRVRDPQALDEFVAHISQYANSQNKVSVSDLSANDPFNLRLEELSRTVWAPAAAGSQLETKWFYERARAQYVDELSRAETAAKKSRFEREYPRKQLFGKTDVAKYEMAWLQYPHIVARGAQKCFVAFRDELTKRGASFRPEESYYRSLIARKILFDAIDRIVFARKYSYKAQVVGYVLGWISHRTGKAFDFEGVWKEQSVPASLQGFLADLVDAVHPIVSTAAGGKNVTDWYKSEACWKSVQLIDLALPGEVRKAMDQSAGRPSSGIEAPTQEEDEEIAWAAAVPKEVWFGIAAWAKRTDSLAPWQRGLAFSLGKLAGQGRAPSRKQAAQGRKIHEEAARLGFDIAEAARLVA